MTYCSPVYRWGMAVVVVVVPKMRRREILDYKLAWLDGKNGYAVVVDGCVGEGCVVG